MTTLTDNYCKRCGLGLNHNGPYCTKEDRQSFDPESEPCDVAMTIDAQGRIACFCTSFRNRQFKHKNRLTPKELESLVKSCPCCNGSGRCRRECGGE